MWSLITVPSKSHIQPSWEISIRKHWKLLNDCLHKWLTELRTHYSTEIFLRHKPVVKLKSVLLLKQNGCVGGVNAVGGGRDGGIIAVRLQLFLRRGVEMKFIISWAHLVTNCRWLIKWIWTMLPGCGKSIPEKFFFFCYTFLWQQFSSKDKKAHGIQ